MKHKLKTFLPLILFPALTVILVIAMLGTLFLRGEKMAVQADVPDGVLYADYFTENSARHEWQLGLGGNSGAPKLVNDSLYFSGNGVNPCAAMLLYELPEKFDMYFTADIARRGGDGKAPTLFFNIGEKYNQRYQIWLLENTIRITYQFDQTIAVKKVEGLESGKAYGFRLAVDKNNIKIYLDGGEEPVLDFTASGEYESFAQARYFGINCYCYEFYFDNLVITDGVNLSPVTELALTTRTGEDTVAAGASLQMMAYLNPSNPSDSALVWAVDNPEIAHITQDGLLTAKAPGEVKVTAHTRAGNILTAEKAITILAGTASGESDGGSTSPVGSLLADDYTKVFESERPKDIFPYSPALCILLSGRIIATCDYGGSGIDEYTPVGYDEPQGWKSIGRVAYSDDGGKTWSYPFDAPFLFGRPFTSGDDLYVIARDSEKMTLAIYQSKNQGETWTGPYELDTRTWHSAPTAPIYTNGYVYMTMEVQGKKANEAGFTGRASLAPVLMRAKEGDDLTKPESWQFSEELAYGEVIPDSYKDATLDYTGIPYLTRTAADVGWLEGNVIQIYDENHQWYDPTGKTFYIYLRGSTLGAGYAAIMKVTEDADGKMTPSLVKAPSGKTMLFVPLPGGNNKFYILYDSVSEMYWLVSNQNTTSMNTTQSLSADRVGEAANERSRLALYFSKNAMDWCFAGLVTKGNSDKEARNYASMAIDGDDLLVLSRSGDDLAESAHDNNLITLHRVENFRDLIY